MQIEVNKRNQMKQKTIILLWGTQGTGKSATIRYLNGELIRAFIDPMHIYEIFVGPGEIHNTLICNNYTVCIESLGDDLNYPGLRERLDDYITQQCDILICTSRLRNNVYWYVVNTLAANHGYRVIKATNYRETEGQNNYNYQQELNQISAIQITDLVRRILGGTI